MTGEELSGRVVVIAGATGGLGSAVVREFAQTEARLVLVGRSPERLGRLAEEIEGLAERALLASADVTQEADVQRMVQAALDRWGRLDVLLNTVGGWSGGKPVQEITPEEWDRMMALNLRSAFLLSRAVLPPMLKSGWGRIVHVASRTAVAPRPQQAAYAVSKMGLITLTEAIAAELKGTGVTANVILPSIIDTPANRRMMPKADPATWAPPEQIAAMMRFLCTDAAASINGARIPIYGAV